MRLTVSVTIYCQHNWTECEAKCTVNLPLVEEKHADDYPTGRYFIEEPAQNDLPAGWTWGGWTRSRIFCPEHEERGR